MTSSPWAQQTLLPGTQVLGPGVLQRRQSLGWRHAHSCGIGPEAPAYPAGAMTRHARKRRC